MLLPWNLVKYLGSIKRNRMMYQCFVFDAILTSLQGIKKLPKIFSGVSKKKKPNGMFSERP